MLFVPLRALEAGPEFFNSLTAPHNCIGGSEQGCAPGSAEAAYLYRDPSKINHPFGVPRPSNWYADQTAEFL